MDTIESKGNTQYGQASDVGEGPRSAERRAWAFQRESMTPEREREVSMEVVSSGSMIEAAGGFVAIVLSILALSGVAPAYLLSAACLVLGVALLIEGTSVAFRFWKLPSEISTGRFAPTQLATGIAAEFLAGLAGIVLGIIALSTILTWTLLAVSVLVFGAALLVASDLTMRMNYLETAGEETHVTSAPAGRRATLVAAGVQVVLGAIAVLFGVLALVGIAPVVLTKIAMLIVGVAAVISGFAITWRLMGALHRPMVR